MGSRYIEPRKARHRIAIVDGVEQIRIPVRRNWFVLAFLPFWLAGWTAGGIAALSQVFTRFDWFLLFWLGGWAAGWVFAASMVVSQVWGAETIRTVQGDLEISSGAAPFARTWRYRGNAIRNLQSAEPGVDLYGMRYMPAPFWMRPKTGAVRFDYGSETLYLANGVDEPEGRDIVAWLARRLPASATQIE